MKLAHTISGPVMSIPQQNTVTVGDVAFHNVSMSEAVRTIVDMVTSGNVAQYVCTGNLDHLLLLQKDQLFRTVYDEADLIVADGMPIVWLSRIGNEAPLKERVAGSDLFWHLGEASQEEGIRLFFLGGVPGSAERAAEAVKARYPGANICGIYCPPFETFGTPEEEERIEAKIRAAKPDVLLVGLGAPKQEKWIAKNRFRLGVPVSIGVGGTFELAGGIVKRAPSWAQKSGMEWLCRLAQDPRRLWRRYLMGDLPFLMKLYIKTVRSVGQPSPKKSVMRVVPPVVESWRTEVGSQAESNAATAGLPFEPQKQTSVKSMAR